MHCDAGTALFRDHCTGAAWEIVTTEAYALSALAHMGELAELGRRLPAAIRDADERGDVYGQIGYRAGVPGMHWLAQDRPAYGRRLADEAIARWPTRPGAFHIQHYLHLIATVQADLYEGDGAGAWRHMCEAWSGLRRGLFLQLETVGVELRFLRGRAALAAAATADARTRRRLHRVVARDVVRIARQRVPTARPFADLLRAALAWNAANGDGAVPLLAAAATGFVRADMALHAAAARHREGTLRGDDVGHALVATSEAWLRTQGIERPDAMVAMLVPGGQRP